MRQTLAYSLRRFFGPEANGGGGISFQTLGTAGTAPIKQNHLLAES